MIPDWSAAACRYEFEIDGELFHILRREQVDGSFLWAVYGADHENSCMSVGGLWHAERLPASRPSNWNKTHRFPTKEAAYAALVKSVQRSARKRMKERT